MHFRVFWQMRLMSVQPAHIPSCSLFCLLIPLWLSLSFILSLLLPCLVGFFEQMHHIRVESRVLTSSTAIWSYTEDWNGVSKEGLHRKIISVLCLLIKAATSKKGTSCMCMCILRSQGRLSQVFPVAMSYHTALGPSHTTYFCQKTE